MTRIEVDGSPFESVADRAEAYRVAVALYLSQYRCPPSPSEALELAQFLVSDYV